ncbi:TerC/Alx family metal homeostasis membrane protein [Nakamurella sp. YIM 132087]|uniref:TerC/Alx family metal homeostasis membrane protein n=1 Tax=Nakamurella alba TaxID=2665158 RepID=A0A7K1FNK7_9ACTN|nr:TerC family protein [Nakamurella alba]MTD15752.1 TerC/Alx family metal homeostasis membrane protein [Nakamurella alba]
MTVPLWGWLAFGAVVVIMLTIDLLAHRGAHVIKFKEAAIWSAVWVGLSLIFAGVIFATMGSEAGVEFTTAWLLEKSLSVDNLFVFALIFGYFAVPREYQHRVLFYGVIGALIFRGIFLAAGVAIVNQFTVILFVFAAVLIYSAFKLLREQDDEDADMSKNIGVRLLRKFYPVSDEYHGTKFFIKEAGKRVATPLLAVVAAIEAADLIFAVDSVPAVLAVSDNTFIIYSSNAFAILGLRALYFLLAGLLKKFHYLGKGLAFILAFIGVKLILQASHKMISTSIPEIPSWVSLIVIVVALAVSIVWSILKPLPEEEDEDTGTEQLAGPDGPDGGGGAITSAGDGPGADLPGSGVNPGGPGLTKTPPSRE